MGQGRRQCLAEDVPLPVRVKLLDRFVSTCKELIQQNDESPAQMGSFADPDLPIQKNDENRGQNCEGQHGEERGLDYSMGKDGRSVICERRQPSTPLTIV